MRKVLIALGAFAVIAAAAALPAGAGNVAMDLVVTIDPTSGPVGTVVTFTPTDLCPAANRGAATNAPGDSIGAVSRIPDPTSPADFVADAIADDTGFWTLDYTIPASEPAGDITFYSFCLYETSPPTVPSAATAAVPIDFFRTAEYLPVVFTVTAPPPSSTTTTSSSTTTTVAGGTQLPSIVASPTNVFPGDTIAVNASGFAPNSTVVITLESDPVNLGSFVADSAGKIATSIVVPADFPAGNHTLKLTGTNVAGAVLVLTTGITVGSHIQVPTTVATVAATTTTLPQTGSSFTEPALVVGGALVLAGAGAVLAARRRRSTTR